MQSSNEHHTEFNKSKKASGVRFAKTIQFFQVPDDVDEREIWYSSEEYNDMKEKNRQAVMRVHRKLRTQSPSSSTDDDGISQSKSSNPTTLTLGR